MGLTIMFLSAQTFTGSRSAGMRHWKAKLTDDQVEEMRVLREDHGWSYGRLARHFKVPRVTVQFICTYRRR